MAQFASQSPGFSDDFCRLVDHVLNPLADVMSSAGSVLEHHHANNLSNPLVARVFNAGNAGNAETTTVPPLFRSPDAVAALSDAIQFCRSYNPHLPGAYPDILLADLLAASIVAGVIVGITLANNPNATSIDESPAYDPLP